MKPGRSFQRVGPSLLHIHWRPGPGRAVVLLHALGTDLRLWDAVCANLPSEMAILRPDLRGHGLSDGPSARIEDHADDVAALMRRASLADAVICGVSMGGMVALSLMATQPDLARGGVLACTGARIGTPGTWSKRIDDVRGKGLSAIGADVTARWFAPGWIAANAEEAAGWRHMLARTPSQGYVDGCRALAGADLRDAAARLRGPVICLAGGEDQATPYAVVADLASAIPDAQVEVLGGVGHLPPVENPHAVADAIRDVATRR